MSKVQHKIGNLYKVVVEGVDVILILAQVDYGKVAAIPIIGGNRWADPIGVEDARRLSDMEMEQIFKGAYEFTKVDLDTLKTRDVEEFYCSGVRFKISDRVYILIRVSMSSYILVEANSYEYMNSSLIPAHPSNGLVSRTDLQDYLETNTPHRKFELLSYESI